MAVQLIKWSTFCLPQIQTYRATVVGNLHKMRFCLCWNSYETASGAPSSVTKVQVQLFREHSQIHVLLPRSPRVYKDFHFTFVFSFISHIFNLKSSAIMGRKGNYDVKEKRGPGRKARKQGEPSPIGIFSAKLKEKKKSSLKRFDTFSCFKFIYF